MSKTRMQARLTDDYSRILDRTNEMYRKFSQASRKDPMCNYFRAVRFLIKLCKSYTRFVCEILASSLLPCLQYAGICTQSKQSVLSRTLRYHSFLVSVTICDHKTLKSGAEGKTERPRTQRPAIWCLTAVNRSS